MTHYDSFFHTRHACGHSVYWSDATWGRNAAEWPCPWCGGESGERLMPFDDACWIDEVSGIACFKKKNPDGSCPVPGPLGRTITIKHMTGNVCCERPDVGPD